MIGDFIASSGSVSNVIVSITCFIGKTIQGRVYTIRSFVLYYLKSPLEVQFCYTEGEAEDDR